MKKRVVVDIDGTITKVGDRVECLKSDPPDWDSFYARCGEDEPVRPILDLLESLSVNTDFVFCSGRRESCREDTEIWFKKHSLPGGILLLRADGDFRHDAIVKPEMLANFGIELKDIAFVLEDRNSMFRTWREMGLTCLQVAEGDF